MTLFASRTTRAAAAGSQALSIVRLDRTGWRVSRPQEDAHDPVLILGFIERLGRRRFEVLWLGPPTGWAYVATFSLALNALARRDEFSGVIAPVRDSRVEAPAPAIFHRIKRRSSAQQSRMV